jgi:HK97 family phage portal protein
MSLLASLRATDERSMSLGQYNIKDPLTGIFSAPSVNAGVNVNEYTALNYSAVWAAVQRISGDVGSLPLVLYKRVGAGKEPLRDHPLYRLLHDQPNPEMTAVVFRETLQAHLLTWGNAYAEIEWRVGGGARALWPISPNRVTPERDAGGRLYYKVQNSNGREVFIEPENMLHIPGLGFDGTCGYSVIRIARESIGLGIATERFGGAFFGNGTTFGGILTHPGRLSDTSRKNIRDSIKAMHGGVDRAHKFGLFEEGMTFTQLGVKPDDAQFLETRKFQVTEIARWFQIPPHMLADLERATFSNIEQQQIDYYTGTLRRWLVRWEQEINRKLVLQSNTQFVEHVIDGLLRGDIESRYAAYAVGRTWGWLSADDVRAKENQNPLPDGSGAIYMVPTNMAPADKIHKLVDAQIKQMETPAPAPGDSGDSSRTAAVIAELRAQIESLGTHRAAAEQVVDALAQREVAIATITAQLDEARKEMVSIQKHIDSGVSRTTAQADKLDEMWWKHEDAAARLDAALAAHVRERDDLVRELEAIRDAATADREARQAAEVKAQTAISERDALQIEFRHAQEQHHVSVDTERTERARLQAELTRHVDLVSALESDVADRTRQLDDLNDARDVAVKAAEDARDAERAALSDKVVSVTEATAARQAVTEADTRAAAAVEAATEAARQAGEAAAMRDVAVRDLADIRGQLETARTELTQTVAERADAVLKLEAELQAAKVALERERQRAEAEAAARADAEAKAGQVERALTAHRQSETERMAAVIGAHRALVADVVGRMVRRQAERARRYQATPEKLRRWLETFATVEEPICVEAMLPAVRTHLAWMRSDVDPATVAADFAKRHLELFAARLRSAADSEGEDFHVTLEAVLQRWEADRPGEVADGILQEGIAHVRAR